MPRWGGAPQCARCQKSVYAAEEVAALGKSIADRALSGLPSRMTCIERKFYTEYQLPLLGQKYHQTCFTCKSCSKGLASGNFSDKDGEIYCKNCHRKAFGPTGFHAGVTITTGINDPIIVSKSEAKPAPVSEPQLTSAPAAGANKFCTECGAKDPGSLVGHTRSPKGGSFSYTFTNFLSVETQENFVPTVELSRPPKLMRVKEKKIELQRHHE